MATTKKPSVRDIVVHVLGNKFTWTPGSSKVYKDSRYTSTHRVDYFKVKYVSVTGIPELNDTGCLESMCEDKEAVALLDALVTNGYKTDNVIIFSNSIMFSTKTPITITEHPV